MSGVNDKYGIKKTLDF